ncbi:MAG TPA: glycoside hydrolase family 1 protein [Lapidilactobacillus dextrinicus]|uniref:Glycoside hydrolase family 1 protein n=1 Tax=Lapidilactobacillus dextrinicus TaxID=51664 RepID=A0A921DUN7_9LACO|nr:glycoside hydrolase family 1 protein [Lapidilactobacillus dextrinicus]
MSNTTLRKDFLWGNSVSSMQTEGAYNEGGKGPSVYDLIEPGEHRSDWKVATDDYHRYAEDFDLMKDLGMNCYRFQISWSRVQPDGEGEFNEEGIQFYSDFIDGLIERGIEPMICLYHFDMPLALAQKYHGFMDRHVVDAFVRYGQEMIDRFGDKVKYWLTFNEQNLYSTPTAPTYAGALDTPGTLENILTITHHVMLAHARVAKYLHEQTSNEIGGMLAYTEIYPATSKPEDNFYTEQINQFYNYNLLDAFTGRGYVPAFLNIIAQNNFDIIKPGDLAIVQDQYNDFMPFSYYRSTTLSAEKVQDLADLLTNADDYFQDNPNLKTTEWNWQIDPLGFRNIIVKIWNRYRKPIFPIENGIGVIEEWNGKDEIQDDYRIKYHRDHLQALKDAVAIDGVDVIGYLGWGLIDILSSQGDMRKRYGVVYVNRTNHDLRDLKRMPKKSYHWLQKVIASNGENL